MKEAPLRWHALVVTEDRPGRRPHTSCCTLVWNSVASASTSAWFLIRVSSSTQLSIRVVGLPAHARDAPEQPNVDLLDLDTVPPRDDGMTELVREDARE